MSTVFHAGAALFRNDLNTQMGPSVISNPVPLLLEFDAPPTEPPAVLTLSAVHGVQGIFGHTRPQALEDVVVCEVRHGHPVVLAVLVVITGKALLVLARCFHTVDIDWIL